MREFLKKINVQTINDKLNYEKTLSERIISDDERPTLYNNIEGYENVSTLAGIVSNRDLLATSVGLDDPLELADYVGKALDNPLPPKKVDTAPFLDQHFENPDVSKHLPIPIFYKGKQYLTASIVVALDPESGRRNASIHRMMYLEKNRFVIRPIPQRHLHSFYVQALEMGKKSLDIVILMGVHPIMELAASTSYPDLDEVAFASRLLGGMKVYDLDGILVPADTEIVMKGKMLEEETAEGPFIDLTGTEDKVREQPIVEITDLYMRNNAIFRTILPGRREHRTLMGIPQEPRMKRMIKNTIPTVQNVVMTVGGGSWLHAVVQIIKRTEGDGKNTILAALAAHPSLKRVVVVDMDVNPDDPNDVEWAIATRCQADKDLVLVPGAKGSSLDPSAGPGSSTCKWGIDATKPIGGKGFDRVI
ncbi:MAG: Phenolic acid decarboxylase subunit C [Candidatus Heimdallarchaeota archaeon LC_3]|nr:MAG: Phenolic acid decarboxylase subunit C [Candidatus Heimdallarchaeota archaeon LC_3]